MDTTPSDFLEDLGPAERPRDKMINGLRWTFVILLIIVVLYEAGMLLNRHSVLWKMDVPRIACNLVQASMALAGLVQLIRRKPSGWGLGIMLSFLFFPNYLFITYRTARAMAWSLAVYTAGSVSLVMSLLIVWVAVAFLLPRGQAFFGVKPKTVNWVLPVAVILMILNIVFVLLPQLRV